MFEHFEEALVMNDIPPMDDQITPVKRALGQVQQRRPTRSASGYKGVTPYKQTGRWRAKICAHGVVHDLGAYDTPEEAAAAYNWFAVEFFGNDALLNDVPMSDQRPAVKLTRSEDMQRKPRQKVAKFRGVVLDKQTGEWQALIMVRKQEHHLGAFDTAEQAAAAYNRAAVKFFGAAAVLNDLTARSKIRCNVPL